MFACGESLTSDEAVEEVRHAEEAKEKKKKEKEESTEKACEKERRMTKTNKQKKK